jgi:hypothetical protein
LAKIINITDRLSTEKPSIIIGEKSYSVNDGMDNVLKFEELAGASTMDSMTQALELSLGKEVVEELGVKSWSINNFKVLTTAILAAMQGIEYEEAEARFPQG